MKIKPKDEWVSDKKEPDICPLDEHLYYPKAICEEKHLLILECANCECLDFAEYKDFFPQNA